jgi:hypothetical protein
MSKPFTPERMRPATHLYRAAAAHLRAHAKNISVERVIKSMFDGDDVTVLVAKAASTPAMTSVPAWAGALAATVVDDHVQAVTSLSAAAGLFARGLKANFGGYHSIRIPGRFVDASDAGAWIAEGGNVPVRTQRMTAGPTLTPRKLMVITSYTDEMIQSSNIEAVSRALISEATALKLDATLFGTQADDGTTPAGILNGITGVTPAPGGGANALIADIKALIGALVTAGAGASPVLITNPAQAVTLSLLAGPKFNIPVLQSSAIAAGTVIAVEPASFVSAFGAEPSFEVSPFAMLTFDDAPANFPAGNVKSTFQTDEVALRMVLRAAWGMRVPAGAPGPNGPHVTFATNVTW